MKEAVDHPEHYGGADNPYEAIKVIEAWDLGFHLGNAVKYISRAGKKGSEAEDIDKAIWYLKRHRQRLSDETPDTAVQVASLTTAQWSAYDGTDAEDDERREG